MAPTSPRKSRKNYHKAITDRRELDTMKKRFNEAYNTRYKFKSLRLIYRSKQLGESINRKLLY